VLENDELYVEVTRHSSQKNILYAFVCDGDVKYIGKTVRALSVRMSGYKNPGLTFGEPKEIPRGRVASSQYDPVLFERYGAVLLAVADLFEAGNVLFAHDAALRDCHLEHVGNEVLQRPHGSKPGRVTVPVKPSDDLAPGTLSSILKQA
jgi:hypothetical protein